jgi:hypothetical protein
MVTTQLERLNSDLQVIDNFVSELKEEGQSDLLKKVLTKRNYLHGYIKRISG